MTDISQTTIKLHYRRQIQPRQYETAEVSMDVEHTFDAGLSPEEIEAAARRMAQNVKVGVLEQLGLAFEQNEDTRIIMEVFPNSEVVAKKPSPAIKAEGNVVGVAPATAAPAAPEAPEAPTPAPTVPKPAARRTGPNAAKAASQGTDTDAAWEDVARNPGNWYYNAPEEKTNPKGPDFKATNKSGWKSADGRFPMGLWLNTKPEDLVLPDDGYANS